MKTFMKRNEDVNKAWVLIDAEGKILGRLATKVAMILRGKTKPEYTPHVDTGDNVIVVNAEKIKVTGKKLSDKKYQTYSGYPSGQKEYNLQTMLKNKPEDVIKLAVKGMLPKNTLGRKMLSNLKVYKGSEHPHVAQNPKEIKI